MCYRSFNKSAVISNRFPKKRQQKDKVNQENFGRGREKNENSQNLYYKWKHTSRSKTYTKHFVLYI